MASRSSSLSGRPKRRSSFATRWPSAPTVRFTSSRTAGSGIRRRPQARSPTRSARTKPTNGPFDLVLFGNEAADSGGFQVGIRVAYALGRPVATGLKGVAVEGGTVRCEQEVAGGRDVYILPLPAVVTVLEGLNLPRYPSVPAKLRAQRKPVDSSSPSRPATRLEKLRLVVPESQGKEAAILGHGPEAAPAVVEVLQRIGVA